MHAFLANRGSATFPLIQVATQVKKTLSAYACEVETDIRSNATAEIVENVFCLLRRNRRLQSLLSVSVHWDKLIEINCLSSSAAAQKSYVTALQVMKIVNWFLLVNEFIMDARSA